MTGTAAFVTGTCGSALRGVQVQRRAVSQRPSPTMRTTPGKSGKKVAPIVFATDIKGNFVWTLRTADVGDVSAISELTGPALPVAMLQSFVEDSPCCMVCEASVKGTKEGEGYGGRVMGAAVVDVRSEVRDKSVGFSSGLVQKGEVVWIGVSDQLPEAGVTKKLALGCLKKMKANGAVEAMATVPVDSPRVDEYTGYGFREVERSGGRVKLTCNLVATDPDPQKKMQ